MIKPEVVLCAIAVHWNTIMLETPTTRSVALTVTKNNTVSFLILASFAGVLPQFNTSVVIDKQVVHLAVTIHVH